MTANQAEGLGCVLFFGSITIYSLVSGRTLDRYRTVGRADSPIAYWLLTTMWGALSAFSIYGLLTF